MTGLHPSGGSLRRTRPHPILATAQGQTALRASRAPRIGTHPDDSSGNAPSRPHKGHPASGRFAFATARAQIDERTLNRRSEFG